MKKLIALFGLMLFLTSCAFNGTKLSSISIGMSKQEVIKALGKPKTQSARGNVEVLHYVGETGWSQGQLGFRHPDYGFVRLVDGKVESYGPELKKHPVTESNPPIKDGKQTGT